MIPKQTNEFNCGPTALSYFLALHDVRFSAEFLELVLEPTEEFGTNPQAITDFLSEAQLTHEVREWPYSSPIQRTALPLLVNVNYENDGDHYLVVTAWDQDLNVTVWDPYTAEVRYYPWPEFKANWYSPLKGLKNWCLYLT